MDRAAPGDRAALEAALQRAVREARERWPTLALEESAFVAAIAEFSSADADPLSALASLHAADFYLARACLAGCAVAQRELVRLHLARVREWVAHVDRSEAFADDVRQEASRRLLLADGGAKLATYSGRGALGAFIRVFVTRVALKMKKGRPEVRYDEAAAGPARDLDPEVALLKRRFAKEFKEAIRATLANLERDERNVLKLHHLDGLSIDEVAAAYQVSRATAARWLAKARKRILVETERALAARLGNRAPSAASLLALIQSQLDESIMTGLRR
jgi:RNA polymerase sigma-70 factor, ECF subfamily